MNTTTKRNRFFQVRVTTLELGMVRDLARRGLSGSDLVRQLIRERAARDRARAAREQGT